MSNEQIEEMSRHIQNAVGGCSTYWSRLISEALYDAGYSKQIEWISVEERLPEKQANFLIADDKGHMEIALWTKQFGWFSGSNRVKKVTHWMPLPEPPKMKGGAE